VAAADGQVTGDHPMSADLLDREAVRTLVQRTAMLLDDEKFGDWLALFENEGTYELAAYSPEIRRWMTWQLSDHNALAKMLAEAQEHVRDPARRRHVIGLPLIELEGDQGHVTTSFSLFRTTPDGQSALYMVGCYEDRIVKRSGAWRYVVHKVIAETRMLDTFTHIPL
jgi:3-phenylpropionate/cinnamic acid dioxygenase small subunit